MHIIFYLHFGCDPRNLKQIKDPRRELEVSQIFIYDHISNFQEDQFDFNIFSPIISNNKINERRQYDFFNRGEILEKKC